MSGEVSAATVLLCCSVFQAEVEALAPTQWPHAALRFPDSMLHMQPGKLAVQLDVAVDEELRRGRRVVLIYGDCCERMAALAARPGVVRTRGANCCDLLLGRDEYRRLARGGAFFLLPEWTHRWREVFASELGLNQDNATSLMRDLHRTVIYLDTGVVAPPTHALQACAEYCGLPCEVHPVSLDNLRIAVQEALDRLGEAGDFPRRS